MNEKVVLAVRVLFGLGLLVFGFNKFFGFMPRPEMTEEAGAFMGALFKTGYILPIAGLVQIAAGVSFLTNKFVPLMAIVLFPIMLNALLVHAFLDLGGIALALIFTLLNVFIMIVNKPAYEPLLKP